jgi:AraC-like DNA-binding protein
LSPALAPVSPAAFNRAVALLRLVLHDLQSTAGASIAGSRLEDAMRTLNLTQTEVARLRGEPSHRLPEIPQSSVQPPSASHACKLVEAMRDFVHQQYHRPINLDEVASSMRMNASYLSSLFRRTTGVTFHHFLQEVRLTKAKELLRDPRNRISNVAAAAGYASLDAFRHAFRASEGLPPTAWRAGR